MGKYLGGKVVQRVKKYYLWKQSQIITDNKLIGSIYQTGYYWLQRQLEGQISSRKNASNSKENIEEVP